MKKTYMRDDFIAKFAENGYTKKDSAIIIDDFIKTIEDILVSGDAVMLRGFGSFDVRCRKERNGVNPQTREANVIPATLEPRFVPGKHLKRVIREGLVLESE